MSGSGLDDLKRQKGPFNPATHPSFPAYRTAQNQDALAAQFMHEAADRSNSSAKRRACRRIAKQLGYGSRGERAPNTRASRVTHGQHEIAIGQSVWQLIDLAQVNGRKVSFATLIPLGGDIRPGDVKRLNPRRWARQLKADIRRARQKLGVAGPGWIILFLEAEEQLAEGLFRFHWHGFACGSGIEALDALRGARKYASPKQKPGEPRSSVRSRVKLTRKPLTNLAYLSVYPLKPEWRARPVKSNQAGNRKRSYPVPLSSQYRALSRLFYDRWTLQDLSMVIGLRVVGGRLVETHP